MKRKLPEPPETREEKTARLIRERKMLEDRQNDPYYDWQTGQIRARIEDE